MKSGANRKDIITITQLAEQGETAEFISTGLQIDLDVVKGFMPDATAKESEPKEKTKTKSGKSKLADSFAA